MCLKHETKYREIAIQNKQVAVVWKAQKQTKMEWTQHYGVYQYDGVSRFGITVTGSNRKGLTPV